MLVLSRKKNERIVINNDITVVVVEIRGDKVRLGVRAPKEIPVHRREVYEAIKRGAAGTPSTQQEGSADPSVQDTPQTQEVTVAVEQMEKGGFLVLSRKKNESIVIGDSITIVVVEIRGDKVRLGLEAPKEVPVHRGEVQDAIEREATKG
jgi:carbon storage regulator